jgi:hypothetical protein
MAAAGAGHRSGGEGYSDEQRRCGAWAENFRFHQQITLVELAKLS